ncbi:MAG: hypothetical protein Q9164_004989 [Protoblastenia rupestris]
MNPYDDPPGAPGEHNRTSSPIRTPELQTQGGQWMAQKWSRLASDANVHGLEALSAAALYSPQQANTIDRPASEHSHEDPFQSAALKGHVGTHVDPLAPTAATNNPLDYILNPPSAESPIDPSLSSPDAQSSTAQRRNLGSSPLQMPGVRVESEHEIAYLLRHFSESPGQWVGE